MPGDSGPIADNPCVFALAKGEAGPRNRPLPPLAADQVRVRVEASMVSPGTELHFVLDNHSKRAEYPVELGYMSAGRIVGVGDDVAGFSLGQRVLAVAGHSAAHNIDPARVHPLPDRLSAGDACPAILLAVSLRAIRFAEVRFGDGVAVVGLGLVGLYALHLAKLAGAFPVIGVDPVASRREIARALGADHVVDPTGGSTRDEVLRLTRGVGAEATIDATGSPTVIASLPAMTATNGRVAVLGGVHAPVPMDLYTDLMKRNLAIVGCGTAMPRDLPHDERRNIATLIAMIDSGMVRVGSTITHRVPVREAPRLYELMIRDKNAALGVVFDWR